MPALLKKELPLIVVLIVMVGAGAVAIVSVSNHHANQAKAKSSSAGHGSAAPTSVTTVLKSVPNYTGQEVSLKGTITQASPGVYYLIEQKYAIKLDFSQTSIDPGKYVQAAPSAPAAPATNPAKQQPISSPAQTSVSSKSTPSTSKGQTSSTVPGAVTVIGKVTQASASSQPVLVVNSIN